MKKGIILLIALMLMAVLSIPAFAGDLKIAIMQDKPGDAQKFKPLGDYLRNHGVTVSFVTARNYSVAAEMFAAGQVDAMFSGSGVAGTMLIKDVAYPVVRPLSDSGTSTYWAVVLAPKGSPAFTENGNYFEGKRVIFSSLASSGEFYFHSIPGATSSGATVLKANSHSSAIDALARGKADVAIVKNWVWADEQGKYPNIQKVGEDKGQNPDGTLIASVKSNPATIETVKTALMGLGADTSGEATVVKQSLGIKGFLNTTKDDFSHTVKLLQDAGVTKDFNFEY